MNKETLRMQMLAGIITEGQYKEKMEEENLPFDPKNFKKGDKISISPEVSNRPLGGYATFWEYSNGRIGYKTYGSNSVSYIDPQYVSPRN